jgi:hypothetical protein
LGIPAFYTIENDQIKEIEPAGSLLAHHNSKLMTPLVSYWLKGFEFLNETQVSRIDWNDYPIDTINYSIEGDTVIIHFIVQSIAPIPLYYDAKSDRLSLVKLHYYQHGNNGSKKYYNGFGPDYETDYETVLLNGLGKDFMEGDSIYFNNYTYIFDRD